VADQEATGCILPRDDNSERIQVLSLANAGSVHINSIEASSNRIAVPTNAEIIRISASGSVWLAFGNSTVSAAAQTSNSMLFTAGAEVFHLRDESFTNIAALSVTGEGSVLVSISVMN